MKILYAASEGAPFIKTGGLGDVAEALPLELCKIDGNEIVVFLPFYKAVKENDKYDFEFVTSFEMPLAWRNLYCGLYKYRAKNKRKAVTYYFIDNEYYFCRNSCYGHIDDGEIFAYFSKAVLEALQYIDFVPDIIHCNDWQTAYIPLFYKEFYSKIEKFSNIKTVFTIHNIEYQGKADNSFLSEVLGVGEEWRGVVTFGDCVNAMKSAVVLCDKLTTVSPTYSCEILYAYFAHGLENILSENRYKLSGIVNGINTDVFNPKTDKNLYMNYNSVDLKGKTEDKLFLQQQLGLEVNADIPVFAIISRLVAHKGIDLVEKIMNELSRHRIQLIILGTGDAQFEDTFKYYDYVCHDKISANIKFDGKLASQVYAGADFLLMPSKSEPCGLSQMIAMRYGTIPIVRETGGLFDTVLPLNTETLEGYGFTFKTYDANDLLDAINRAETFYYNKEKREKVIKKLLRLNLDWKQSAQKYMELYESTGKEY